MGDLFRRVGSLSDICFSFKNKGEIPDYEEECLNLIFQFGSVGHSTPEDIFINDQGTITVHNLLESKERWNSPYIPKTIYSQKKLVYSPDHGKILLLTRPEQNTDPEEEDPWNLEKQFDLNAKFILRDHTSHGDWSLVVFENQYSENFYLINFAEQRNSRGKIEEFGGTYPFVRENIEHDSSTTYNSGIKYSLEDAKRDEEVYHQINKKLYKGLEALFESDDFEETN